MRLFTPIAVAGLPVVPLAVAALGAISKAAPSKYAYQDKDVGVAPCFLGSSHDRYALDPKDYGPDYVLDVDVAVVRGGSVGTYAAI